MTLLVLSQRQFNGLLESVPTIARKMLAALANRLREADAKASTDRRGRPPRTDRDPRR